MLARRDTHRIEFWLGAFLAAAASIYVFVELRPDLLFRDTTTNGGDTGAHVWWPAYMRDHVFPKLRLSGWAPDWYAGFPVGHFYFPIPALLIVALDVVAPYNVAFKLVTVMGPVLIPVAAFAFGRGIRAPFPAPPLFAAATLPFLFFATDTGEYSLHIAGGNLPSTLAGEFSYALSLALSLFFLGALARALDDRDRLWLPALLLGLTVTTHIIGALFAVVGAVVLWLSRHPRRTFWMAAAIGGTAALLSAIWVLPMLARLPYATDMGWGKVTHFRDHLLHPDLQWALILGGVALVVGAAALRRATLELAALVAIFALMFRFLPEGRIWNLRVFPFYHLSLSLLAAMGIVELVLLVRAVLERRAVGEEPIEASPEEPVPARVSGGSDDWPGEPALDRSDVRLTSDARRLAGHLVAGGAAVMMLVASLVWVSDDDVHKFIPGWIEWNYTGYEAKPAYPEYREIMDTLDGFPRGGRLLWERLNRINDYGSDLALELIPYWTDGKVGSMEGLYFESAGTTPFHFMTVAEVAAEPSNPVRGLPYRSSADSFDLGVRHMQMMGVRYFMAGADQTKEKASAHDDLRFVVEIGNPDEEPAVARWAVYEVLDSPVVAPLEHEPVVLSDVGAGNWREPAVAWWNDPQRLDRVLAQDGPSEWERATESEAESGGVPERRLPPVEVSDVELGDDSVRFRVSRTGVPVLVKVSYFPNWQADGADGPWRVTPNFMVVVPTDEEVELTYGRTAVDRGAIVLTLLGIVGLVALARWRPRTEVVQG
ncbi:MAG TPA: hypothetical protein VM618_02585 [Acidimicrobiia bacterium]|nr:hypothetical protein [Acidimicrobiia bacterium]